MFDFHKSIITGIDFTALIKNELLNFSTPVNTETGEIAKNTKTATCKNLLFEIVNDTYFNLQGSFHKYHNGGEHNYNDFAATDNLNVLIDLHENFSINPFLATLNNLEFGVNVLLPFTAKELLNSIISYKGKEIGRAHV